MTSRKLISAYWIVTVSLFAIAMARLFGAAVPGRLGNCIVWLVGYTPDEVTMGPIQKIFYLHLPVAISTFLACLVAFIASIGYLVRRDPRWDDLAAAAARVAVQLCTVVLLTGMIWGKSAWGQWWTWSPRLTFSLVLWLLYAVYLIVRSSIESRERRAVIAAVYAVIAFLDVPLVYLSVRLMPDIHPTAITLAPEMKLTLGLFFAAVTALTAGLIVLKQRLNVRERLYIASARRDEPIAIVGGITC
jgi:heme exporter protein C